MGFVDWQARSWDAVELATRRLRGEVTADSVATALTDASVDWQTAARHASLSGDEVAEPLALFAGRCQAALAHALLQSAYTIDALTVPGPAGLGVVTARYEDLLGRARSQAIAASPDFEPIRGELLDLIGGDALTLAGRVGGLDPAGRGDRMIGTRTCGLLRRCVMLLAGLTYLEQRVVDGRSAAGLRRSAEHRTVLRDRLGHERWALPTVAGRAELERVEVAGRVSEVGWVRRPTTPYSFARLEGARFELRVHYRSLMSVGVAPGRWVWVKGKYELSDGVPVVVAEFEGLGNRADAVWEDWLALQVRSAYELAPSSLDMSWEFPDPRYQCGMSDFRSRFDAQIGGA